MTTPLGYRAHIQDDFISGGSRLLIVRGDGVHQQIMYAEAEWREFDQDSVTVDSPGLFLPHDAKVAVYEAAKAALGKATDSDTESAVLREWLLAERERVDQLFFGGDA